MDVRHTPLDGMRGVAVLLVICVHAGAPFTPGGGRGVDMFFVLSGYLITGILLKDAGRGGLEYGRFWARRFWRLSPALVALIVAYVIAAPTLFPDHAADRWAEGFYAGAYLMDYIAMGRAISTPLTHTWSLAIEAQFYLIWPFVAVDLARLKSPAFVLTIAWAALTLLRIIVLAVTMDGRQAYFPLHTHATGLVVGAALACAPKIKVPAATGWLGVLAFAAAVIFDTEADGGVGRAVWGIAVAELATAAIIAGLVGSPVLARALSWRPLAALGVISYGIYLWHWPLVVLLGDQPWWIKLPSAFVGATAIAALSYWTVEWPARAWRKADRRPAPTAQASP